MTDLEMTRKCAEKMGFTVRPFTAKSVACYPIDDCAIVASNEHGGDSIYDPLHDDAQAMALVKRFNLSLDAPMQEKSGLEHGDEWEIYVRGVFGEAAHNANLNRAIVECVAKLEG